MQGEPGRRAAVAAAFLYACRLELAAPKPGNVHRFAAGHGMTVADFERSAEVSVAAVAACRPGVGARVHQAVAATRAAVGQNTNLGILLLVAPLAEAFLIAEARPDLETATCRVLATLDIDDARQVFAAIRLAAPGGLGRADQHDVAEEPEVPLSSAMRAAANRDRIAWNYVHGFSDIFRRGLTWWRQARARGRDPVWACTELYLRFLATIPDTHLARRHAASVADAVCRKAAPICDELLVASRPEALLDRLLAFDAALKEAGLNPGTTADLTVATVFAACLEDAQARASR